jgi:hypothetical protein
MANKTNMTIKISDFNQNYLSFTKLEENQRSRGQKIAYPRYTNPKDNSETQCFIQFPWIKLNSYGVPKIGEYYSDDSQRSFVKIPLDQSIPEIKQLSDMLRKIDEQISSDEFKEKMFGSKASKYQLQPIFRLPPEEDEDNKNNASKKYGPKHPYMKLKIDTSYPDNEIKTVVFNSVVDNGTRIRTKVEDVKTIDDFASNICWLSCIHPVVSPVKFWAQAPNKKDPTYGITFKIIKVEVEPPPKMNSNIKEFINSDAFLDSDEEIDNVEAIYNKPIKSETDNKQVVAKQPVAQVTSDDESEDEDEVITKPVINSTTKILGKKVVELSDSDEESEEESEEESDEEVKPAKPAKKSDAKKTQSKVKKSSA